MAMVRGTKAKTSTLEVNSSWNSRQEGVQVVILECRCLKAEQLSNLPKPRHSGTKEHETPAVSRARPACMARELARLYFQNACSTFPRQLIFGLVTHNSVAQQVRKVKGVLPDMSSSCRLYRLRQ